MAVLIPFDAGRFFSGVEEDGGFFLEHAGFSYRELSALVAID